MLAAQLSQGESDIWIECANLNKKFNNKIQAEYCLTRALKIEKDSIYLLSERALILEELCKYKKAANEYEKLFQLTFNGDLLLKISQLYEMLEMHNFAIEIIEENFDKVDNNLFLVLRLFDLYIKLELPKKGVIFFENLKCDEKYSNIKELKIRYLLCCLRLSQNGQKLKSDKDIDGLSLNLWNERNNTNIDKIVKIVSTKILFYLGYRNNRTFGVFGDQ